MNLLALSGSLRAASSNQRALDAIALLAPDGVTIERAPAIDSLPFFNPDVEQSALPPAIVHWRARIAQCDALIVSSPEYAHGVPGALKNALDWLVGGIEIIGKPIALVNATPPAEYSHAQLRETLRVMGGAIVDDACITLPLRGRSTRAEDIAKDEEMAKAIRGMFAAIAGVRHQERRP